MNAFAERRRQRIERMRARAARWAAEGHAAHERATASLRQIPMGQPILVGHHSEGRHRRHLKRIDAGFRVAWEKTAHAKELARRADRAEKSRAISSDDPEAVTALREKLVKLEDAQDRMKRANRALKSKKGATDVELAAIVGTTPEKASKLREKDFAGRIGFPDYAIKNNNAEIRRIKARIEELLARRAAPPRAAEHFGDVRVFEADNRVRIAFPDKPSEAVRARCKASGFHWSPSEGVWQRMASNQAWYAARQIAAAAAEAGR